MSELTPQQVFDTVVAHLRQQGRPSKGVNPDRKDMLEGEVGCLYRGPDGLKCAVGCLIKDEEYNPGMEGIGVHGLPWCSDVCPASLADRLRPHVYLLNYLQDVHDNTLPQFWEERFESVARKFNLTLAPKTS